MFSSRCCHGCVQFQKLSRACSVPDAIREKSHSGSRLPLRGFRRVTFAIVSKWSWWTTWPSPVLSTKIAEYFCILRLSLLSTDGVMTLLWPESSVSNSSTYPIYPAKEACATGLIPRNKAWTDHCRNRNGGSCFPYLGVVRVNLWMPWKWNGRCHAVLYCCTARIIGTRRFSENE